MSTISVEEVVHILGVDSETKGKLESEFSISGLEPGRGIMPEQTAIIHLDPRITELYEGVAETMAQHISGELPKAFGVIPKLRNWEQILKITKPGNWTSASIFEATKIFTHRKQEIVQRFYSIVLLPRFRKEIREHKELDDHLYNALQRTIHKSGAYYNGIVLLLCKCNVTSVEEARIISSIIRTNRIPVSRSSDAMEKIALLPYNEVRCVFLLELISKNYPLSKRTLKKIFDHFSRTRWIKVGKFNEDWHQTLLKFCQLYIRDLTVYERHAISLLIMHHVHPTITPKLEQLLKENRSNCFASYDDDDEPFDAIEHKEVIVRP